MQSSNLYQKNTTFTKRPGLQQIVSYIVFLLEVIFYFAIILPHLHSSTTLEIITILYCFSLLCLVISTIICSSTDPSDQVMILYRSTSRENFEEFRRDCTDTLLYCDYCRSYVKEKSRHCKVCDRCTQNFDHHCMWINNCVGKLNYNSFFAMVLSAFANLLIYVIGMAVLTSQYDFILYLPGFIAAWISGLVNSIFVVLLINLIILHLYLIKNGISTYEFIMAQRQEEKSKKQGDYRNKEVKDQRDNIKQQITPPINSIKVNSPENNEIQRNSMNNLQINELSKETTNIIYVRDRHGSKELPFNEQDTHKNEDARNELIFVEKEITQKSDQPDGNDESQQKDNQISSASSIEISQLFTRNKSLKLIIGKTEFYKPHRIGQKEARQKSIKSNSMYAQQKRGRH